MAIDDSSRISFGWPTLHFEDFNELQKEATLDRRKLVVLGTKDVELSMTWKNVIGGPLYLLDVSNNLKAKLQNFQEEVGI